MKSREEILEFLRRHKGELYRKYRLRRMGLFGSLARGEGKRESDVDILIEFADNSGDLFTLKRELREFLTRTFGRPVDLAREKYLRPYAREAIFRDLIDV